MSRRGDQRDRSFLWAALVSLHLLSCSLSGLYSGAGDGSLDRDSTGTDAELDSGPQPDATMAPDGAGTDANVSQCDFQSGTWTFEVPMPVSELNDPEADRDPFISSDGLRLYLATLAPVATVGGQDIVMAERTSVAGLFSAPALVPGVNSSAGDADPALTVDERVIVFGSSRPGGMGNSDIWFAVRSDRSATFSMPAPLPVVNSSADDGDPFVTADGCELFFYSDRAGTMGSYDIWRARYVE